MDFPFPVNPNQIGGGKLISYISLSPGAGATILGCLHAIYSATNDNVALIDFNPSSKARTYMGLPADVSSASILDLNSAYSPNDLYSAGDKHHSNVTVYPGILKAMDASQVDANLQVKAATLLKQSFPVSVAVLGSFYDSWPTLLVSDIVCVVASPNRPDIDTFRDSMDFLSRLDCGERTKVILNQQGMPGGIKAEDVVKYFNPDFVIDFDNNLRNDCNKRKPVLRPQYRNIFAKMGGSKLDR